MFYNDGGDGRDEFASQRSVQRAQTAADLKNQAHAAYIASLPRQAREAEMIQSLIDAGDFSSFRPCIDIYKQSSAELVDKDGETIAFVKKPSHLAAIFKHWGNNA